MARDATPSTSRSSDRPPNQWGLAEAALAWPAAIFVGSFAYIFVLQFGDYTSAISERPGGHLGRTVGQLTNGDALGDNAVPLVWQMLLLVPGWIVLLGVSWLFAGALGHQRGWSLSGPWSDVSLGVFSGMALQIPVVVLVVLLIQAIFGEIEQSGRALALVDTADTWPKVVLLIVFVGLGAPLVEELFYRGIVQSSLVRSLGPVLGIGLASVIFGAVHLSLIEFAPLAAVGAGLGYLYWRTGRLLPAIIAHATFNLFTLVNLLVASRS